MSPEGRTDCKQTCSSSLMAAMLFWNLSRPQKVEIPSLVFWTRTCSRAPCSGFSESELSCLQQREVGLFSVSLDADVTCLHQSLFNICDVIIHNSAHCHSILFRSHWLDSTALSLHMYKWTKCSIVLHTVPAEDCVFPQFSADLIGLLNHQRQLHGIPLWWDCNAGIKHT